MSKRARSLSDASVPNRAAERLLAGKKILPRAPRLQDYLRGICCLRTFQNYEIPALPVYAQGGYSLFRRDARLICGADPVDALGWETALEEIVKYKTARRRSPAAGQKKALIEKLHSIRASKQMIRTVF